MERFVRHAGSPLSLTVFEAAARHGNFTKAAKEFNVSQPAVSRHIRNLELHYGVRLFKRRGNVIELTPAGVKLYVVVRDSLENIRAALAEICEEQSESPIKIRSDATIFRTFLLSAGTQKKAEELGLSLEFVTVPSHEPVHLDERTIAITYGKGKWVDYHSEKIFDDVLFPICAPNFLESSTDTSVSDALNSSPLLQYVGFLDDWQDWRLWVDKLGMENLGEKRLQAYNDYELLLEACRAGEGIAIGSLCLVAPSLHAGTLIRLTDETVWTQFSYYLVFDSLLLQDRNASLLIDFFKDAAVQRSRQFAQEAGVDEI